MLRVRASFASIALVVALSGGCAPSSTDLQEPRTVAALDATGQPPSREQVAQAIRIGASQKHWAIVSEEPSAIIASVASGGHSATVRIDYDEKGWVILYQESSPGLKYNPDYGGREIIHQRYNLWVRHLNRAIENALLQMRSAPGATSGGAATAAS